MWHSSTDYTVWVRDNPAQRSLALLPDTSLTLQKAFIINFANDLPNIEYAKDPKFFQSHSDSNYGSRVKPGCKFFNLNQANPSVYRLCWHPTLSTTRASQGPTPHRYYSADSDILHHEALPGGDHQARDHSHPGPRSNLQLLRPAGAA